MKYRITGVPVFIGGHLFSRPEDIGREIEAPDGLAGSKLVSVEPETPAEGEPAPAAPQRRTRNA